MNARDALLSVREVVELLGDQKAVHSFCQEFHRRLEALKLVEAYYDLGSTVLDVGASPFIVSCALKNVGYKVVAFDVEPEHYIEVAKKCGVDVVKCNIERDEISATNADCVVFSEVVEHLHYYYAPVALAR